MNKRKLGLFGRGLIVLILWIGSVMAEGQSSYDAKGKRDPFVPLVTLDGRLLKLDSDEQVKTNLVLEGIIFDKNGLSYAIVNGAVVKVGDAIGEYQVLKIEEHKVIFIKEGQTEEVILKEEAE